MGSGERRECGLDTSERGIDLARRPAGDHHERRVEDVLTGRTAVHPRLRGIRCLLLQHPHERDDRIAAVDRCGRKRRRVDAVTVAAALRALPAECRRERLDGIGGRCADRSVRARERDLHRDERVDDRGIRDLIVVADGHRREQS